MQKTTEIITSRQNPLVSLTAALSERKHRMRTGLFRFDGKKLLAEAQGAGVELHAVLLRESAADTLLDAAAPFSDACRVAILPDALFDRISEEKSPEGVICVAKRLDKLHKIVTIDTRASFLETLLPGRTLLLESVRDPGNLGTVIRSAAAFGVPNLVLSSDCADLYHPRAIRGAMGTLFHQHVVVVQDAVDAVRQLTARGRVFAAALEPHAARLGAVTFGESDAVAVGNEGHGLSKALLDAATDSIFIPMASGVESLNAGVAASVLLWEFYRGR